MTLQVPTQGYFVKYDGTFLNTSDVEGLHAYKDKIYLMNNSYEIKIYSEAGVLLETLGGSGSGPGLFTSAVDLYVDTNENLYVFDSSDGSLHKFSYPDYTPSILFTYDFSSEFSSNPYSIAIKDSYVYLGLENGKIAKFSLDGTLIDQSSEADYTAFDIDVGLNGEIYSLQTSPGSISILQKWSESLEVIETKTLPSNSVQSLGIDSEGNLIVGDFTSDIVYSILSDGLTIIKTFGGSSDELPYVNSELSNMAVDLNNGFIYLYDSYLYKGIRSFAFDRRGPVNDFTSTQTSTNVNSFALKGNFTDLLTNVTSIQFKLENQMSSAIPWNNCTADDGAIDEKSENYTCSISNLTLGAHTIYVRSTDSKTNTASVLGYSIEYVINSAGSSSSTSSTNSSKTSSQSNFLNSTKSSNTSSTSSTDLDSLIVIQFIDPSDRIIKNSEIKIGDQKYTTDQFGKVLLNSDILGSLVVEIERENKFYRGEIVLTLASNNSVLSILDFDPNPQVLYEPSSTSSKSSSNQPSGESNNLNSLLISIVVTALLTAGVVFVLLKKR